MERLQGSPSILGLNYSTGVFQYWDETTPGESFCSGMERLHGSHFIVRLNDSRGVLLSSDGTIPGESFRPKDRKTPRE